jgi:hypothetical protein
LPRLLFALLTADEEGVDAETAHLHSDIELLLCADLCADAATKG